MLIYEVNSHVDESVAEDYLKWLKVHVREILDLNLFTRAVIHEIIGLANDRRHWSVHYHAPAQIAVDTYLRDHAPHFRQDAIDRFGGQFETDRRTYKVIEQLE